MDGSSYLIAIHCLNDEIIFISRSFLNDFLDSKIRTDTGTATIKLDVSSASMTQIVEFLERGDPQLNSIANAIEIYTLSKSFRIENLTNFCRQYLIGNMAPQNVSSLHDWACKENDTLLQYHCWELFDDEWVHIFCKGDFLCCQETTIRRLLSRPIYRSLLENHLFEALFHWALTNARNQMGTDKRRHSLEECISTIMQPFLSQIRFLVRAAYS